KRLDEEGGRYAAKIVRDQLAVQLLLKRSRPDALIMPMDSEAERKFAQSVHKHLSAAGEEATLWIGLHRDGQEEPAGQWAPPIPCDAVLSRPCEADEILCELDRLFNSTASPVAQFDPASTTPAVVTAT